MYLRRVTFRSLETVTELVLSTLLQFWWKAREVSFRFVSFFGGRGNEARGGEFRRKVVRLRTGKRQLPER